MGQTVRVYYLVTDVDDCHVLIDNRGTLIYWGYCEETLPPVEVRWVYARHYPCSACKHQNNAKFPDTNIHRIQQRSKSYAHNLKQGKELGLAYRSSGFAEIIGHCDDFENLT